jgi:acylphosphatase
MTGATVVLHLLVCGRVQGVGFRGFADDEARRRGLVGWVRNRVGGAVEIVVAGERAIVDDFVAACRRGPWRARVDHIAIDEATPPELEHRRPGETFSVLSTI